MSTQSQPATQQFIVMPRRGLHDTGDGPASGLFRSLAEPSEAGLKILEVDGGIHLRVIDSIAETAPRRSGR